MQRAFKKKIRGALKNNVLRKALEDFSRSYPGAREKAYREIDFGALQTTIQQTKSGAVQNILPLARQFEDGLTARGVRVHRAGDGGDAPRIIRTIAQRRGARVCVKSKSMTSEEIHLNQRIGDIMRVVETDLGEWIIQQIDEKPSHMVMPAIHLTRETCAEIFSRVTGDHVAPDISGMVKLARRLLRDEFLAADIGITGCNIAAADTGTMVILTNEGNARLTTTLPPVHIVLMGYEKLVPRFEDIGPLVTAIPRSALGQPISAYVTMISGPTETFAGPGDDRLTQKELHVILLDNGRLDLLEDPVFREIGQCVRCCSCLNVCPVYGLVGGQVYGDIYAGGIGALLTAFLNSPRQAEQIQELCLNCGNCRDYCPGKIDIPRLILQLRGKIRDQIPPPFLKKFLLDRIVPHKGVLNTVIKGASPLIRRVADFLSPAPRPFRRLYHELEQRVDNPRGDIGFFHGCMVDYFSPDIGLAVVKVLNRAGYRVRVPDQGCCGAPALYTGLENSARKAACHNQTIQHTDHDHLVSACPTCTVMLRKHRARLLPGVEETEKTEETEPVRDFIGLFHELQKGAPEFLRFSPVFGDVTVTYHYSCHLKRGSGIETEPGDVVGRLPGVTWKEMPEADRCCGFAGTYQMKLPEISAELLSRKIENIVGSGASIVLTDCPGCLAWLSRGLKRAGSKVRAFHTAVFLARYLA